MTCPGSAKESLSTQKRAMRTPLPMLIFYFPSSINVVLVATNAPVSNSASLVDLTYMPVDDEWIQYSPELVKV